ncbi:AI-2E family transporter [Paenibacillus sp. 481]|uniref:AI-2E family transporter n=1 Tax=Paenibacillus sp. 481 TaxID=2835869 RepID=UPI001E44AF82|nr:AI-2E family transporter [Paenibacillus sp. 481]UHA74293.1 AI-2E family transporter [Paenibacillus sp. 481]
MLTFYRKYWRTAFDIALIILTVYLIMYGFSYLYAIAAPIFLALLVFVMIEPLARFLARRGMNKAAASAISVLVFTLIILSSMFGAGLIFISQMSELQNALPQYGEALQKQVVNLAAYLQTKYEALPNDVSLKIKEYVGVITQKGSALAVTFLGWLVGNLKSFSTFIMNFGIAIILAYFLSIEIGDWKRITKEKTPRTFKNAFHFLKVNVFRGIGAYLKAQLKLISITFTLVFVSLLGLGVNNAFSIALLSALFDILPLLGIPVIFIPWIVYLLFIGNTWLAVSLTIVLVVVMLTRQFLEPKITGNTLGVSAFTMLSFMMISLSLFGVMGLIMSPILLILVKALYDQGYLKKWIRMPAEEFDADPSSNEANTVQAVEQTDEQDRGTDHPIK